VPYICSHPEAYDGKKVGTGQCVEFVKECAKAPQTSQWKEGVKVKGDLTIQKGAAIATFIDGKYQNKPTGNHAAVYVSQDAGGIWVYDQWVGQGMVKKRYIRFKGGVGSASNDGDAFSVIN